MSLLFSTEYVLELERIIVEELLPIYERWHIQNDIPIPQLTIPKELLKPKKEIPALLKRK